MRILRGLILAAGFATMGFLLWKLNPAAVWADVSQVGWGFLVILPFQIIDHLLNALGWRFAFSAEDARGLPFWPLVKARMAGDGVNYLTPSGSIAGELIRPGMLGGLRPEGVKNTSVLVAKFAQALAQAVFILVGLLFVLLGHLNVLEGRELALSIGGTLFVVALVVLAICVITSKPAQNTRFWNQDAKISAMRSLMRGYLSLHPGRFVLSTLSFTLGYAWGGVEVLLICRFMGLPISILQALCVETLSNVIDSLMFMVPAKVGTQEAGKTAIFRALGYRASQGLAFGLIRHTRELIWASVGFLLYALNRPKGAPPARPAGSPAPRAGPLARAD